MTRDGKSLCGARRPGWGHGPAIGINRIPCVLSAEHEGDHANAFGQTWPEATDTRDEDHMGPSWIWEPGDVNGEGR